MAEKQTVIIDVQLDSKNAQQNAAKLREKLELQKKELAELRAAYNSGLISLSQFAKQTNTLESEIKKTSGEFRVNQNAAAANANSLNALSASVNKLTLERKQLDTSTAEGKKRFDELTLTIRAQTDRLKELEKAAGDTRRNVGNYEEAIKNALSESELFNNEIFNSARQFSGFIKQIQQAVKGLQGLKLVLATLGIGALIAVLAAISAFFSSTTKGSETLEKAIGFLNGAINKVTQDLAKLGGSLLKVFTNPVESLKKFGDAIVENLTNRVQALLGLFTELGGIISDVITGNFENLSKRIKSLASNAIDFGTGIKDTAAKTRDYAKSLIDAGDQGQKFASSNIEIRKRLRELITEQARSVAELEKIKRLRDDEQLTQQQKIDLINKEIEIEKKRTDQKLELNRLQQQLVKNEIATQGGLQTAREDQLQQLAQLQSETLSIIENFENLTAKAQSETNALRREDAVATSEAIRAQATADLLFFQAKNAELLAKQKITNKEQAEQIQKALDEQLRLEIAKVEAESALAIRQAAEQEKDIERRAKFVAEAEANRDLQIAQLNQGRLAAQQKINDQLIELDKEQAKIRLQIESDLIQAKLATVEKGGSEQLSLQQSLFEIQRQQALLNAEQEIKDLEALNAAKLKINAEFNKKIADSTLESTSKIVDARNREAQATATAGLQIGQSAVEQEQTEVERVKSTVKGIFEIIKARLRETVAAQIAQVITTVPFPVNVVIAGVAGLAVEGLFAALLSGFATGGVVKSGVPVSRSNGDNVLITAKKGEVVLNSSQQQAAGGPSFFKSIGVPGFATGGIVGGASFARQFSISQQSIDIDQLTRSITNSIAKLPQPVVAVQDINKVQNEVSVIQNRAKA